MDKHVELVWDLLLLPVIRLLVEGLIVQGLALGEGVRSGADAQAFEGWLAEWRARPGVDIVRAA